MLLPSKLVIVQLMKQINWDRGTDNARSSSAGSIYCHPLRLRRLFPVAPLPLAGHKETFGAYGGGGGGRRGDRAVEAGEMGKGRRRRGRVVVVQSERGDWFSSKPYETTS